MCRSAMSGRQGSSRINIIFILQNSFVPSFNCAFQRTVWESLSLNYFQMRPAENWLALYGSPTTVSRNTLERHGWCSSTNRAGENGIFNLRLHLHMPSLSLHSRIPACQTGYGLLPAHRFARQIFGHTQAWPEDHSYLPLFFRLSLYWKIALLRSCSTSYHFFQSSRLEINLLNRKSHQKSEWGLDCIA